MKSNLGIPVNGFAEYSKLVATQGIVLLRNDDNCLPILENEKVSIFGRCQIEYYRSGTGSGGAVHVLYNTNVLDSFNKHNKNMVNQELAEIYQNFIKENPFDNGGGGWACEPWSQKELELTPTIVQNAKKVSNKAVVVIGRTAGEDKDNLDVEGSYRLTDLELNMLKQVTDVFDNVCVILNTSNIIDMSWVKDYKINAILCTWNGGMEGGGATVDILTGKATPSGKLPDTIACTIEDYSSTKNHGGVEKNIYQEDIYVGYRYFETFAKDKVLYPFGFGLSYTDFSINNFILEELGDFNFKVKATVKNIGNKYSGSEVVQVYLNAPQGKLGKATRVLVGFAKTTLLQPTNQQTIEISIPKSRLASYDDSGATGHKSAYVLEAGEYEFYIGNSVKATDKLTFNVNELVVVEQLQEALAPVENFDRMRPTTLKSDGNYELSYEKTPTRTINLKERIDNNIPKEIAYTGDNGIKITDVRDNKSTMEDFIAQFDLDELCTLVLGEGMSHPQVTPGTASAFAGVTEKLRSYGIPLICCADGPSGIRMEGGLKSTQVPIGTSLASTWDISIIEELYTFTGKEMIRNFVDVLLGPGMNIHRNPLNGRNFEYFSEDPLLTGLMASSIVKGIEKAGVSGTLKHFACNSQEKYRHSIDSVVSERAVREIYLKGFEIAVREGKANSIMTAYNPINSIWTASNYDLNTTILRNEWGYTGFVMTDWWARMNDTIEGGAGTKDNIASMVKSQNDVYMIVNNFDAQHHEKVSNTKQYVNENKLTIAELQRCAKNIFKFAMNNNAMNRDFELMAQPLAVKSKELSTTDYTLQGNETKIQYNQNKYSIECKESGLYEIYFNFELEVGELAQVNFNMFMNGETVAVMLVGSTKNQIVSKKLCDIELYKGGYEVELQPNSDAFVIDSITFIKTN